MRSIQFSEVQLFNLSALLTLRDCIRHDCACACCEFSVSTDQAQYFGALSIDQIFVIVANVGHESLFVPRPDVLALLAAPPALSGALTAVHPPHKSRRSRGKV